MSSEFQEKIQKVIKDNPIANRHSLFQLKYFVIGKEPTIQSKLWCCLRELKSRYEAIIAIDMELAEANDRLELLDIEIKKLRLTEYRPTNELDKLSMLENGIKIRQLERRKKNSIQSIHDLQDKMKNYAEEADFFLRAFQSLEAVEKYKGFDDLESQTQYWNNKLTEDFNIKSMLSQPLDVELMKTIMALNNDAPIKQHTVKLIENRQQKIVEEKKSEENRG